MRKIRLSDTDLELFDIEIGPTDYTFYQRHKDAFKTMYREQGKPFWTRFQITFRSFTVKHGIIKQMNIDSPKFQNILDQAFIFILENFVDAKESTAKNFIDDVARLAQNQDRFPGLDSKSFAKDPFFTRDTRELFRKFFGPPDQKSSYLKVYILCPVYLRFGGSVCRCLIRWMEAPNMDNCNDDSYWIPPTPNIPDKNREEIVEVAMCNNCSDDCGTKFFREKIMGNCLGPISLDFWTQGDPRFNDPDNPLFAPHLNPDDDWRDLLSVEMFKDFYNYTRFKYGTAEDKCRECQRLKKKRDKFIHVCKVNKRKKKQESKDKEDLLKDLKEVRSKIDELEDEDIQDDYKTRIQNIIKEKPRVREALEEVERKEKLEKLHTEQLEAENNKEKDKRKSKKKSKSGGKEKRQKDVTENGVTNETDFDSRSVVNGVTSDKDTEESAESDVKDNSETESSSREHSVGNGEKEVAEELVKDGENFGNESKDFGRENSKEETINNVIETNAKDGGVNEDQDDEKQTTDSTESEKIDMEKSEEAVDPIGNGPFNHETTKCDHGHYMFLSERDITPNKNIVSGFKVIKIEDADNGLFEVNVSAACIKTGEEGEEYRTKMKEQLRSQELNNFIMSANLLREKIYGLPEKLEWWEGRGFAVAVVNYEAEEKEFTKNWTNFTLKVNGYDENAIKLLLVQLLIYVSKRKHRLCYGWNMEVDDVVACVLPEESPAIEDLSISISRGFRFEDRLTDFEKETLHKHYPNLNLDLCLCGIDRNIAVKTLNKKGGKEKMRRIIDLIAEKEIIAKDLPVVDVEKLRKKLNNKEEISKSDILWEQFTRKPDKFEVFMLIETDLVYGDNDWWDLGLKSMDIRLYNSSRNPDCKICPMCKVVGMDCTCEKPIEITPKVVEFVESPDFDKAKTLGDVDESTLPKMLYTETSLSSDKTDKPEKKWKQSKSAKKKEKRIEIKDLPKKLVEAGLDADRTSITIPSREEEPMLGKMPIQVADKTEKLAPVPGVHSSLNFTFQNGKKEQTITVTLGAYMPEDKMNEIQEKKELLKIMEEEEKRNNSKALEPPEKKDKKEKKKKEKSKSKSPQKNMSAADVDEDKSTQKEKAADVTARFLKEVFSDEKKLMQVTKTIHQHMGLSNKQQAEKKAVREELKAKAGAPKCTCPHHDQIQKIKQKEEEERRLKEERRVFAEQLKDIMNHKGPHDRDYSNDPEMQYIVDKVLGPKQESQKPERKTKGSHAKADKKSKTKSAKADESPMASNVKEEDKAKTDNVVRSKSAKKRKARNAEVESAEVDKLPDETASPIIGQSDSKSPVKVKVSDDVKVNGDIDGEVRDVSSDERDTAQSLRLCGYCLKVEPARKAFKKCQKCKDEGVLEVRYYCSRDCQVDDWKKRHKMEHKEGLLG